MDASEVITPIKSVFDHADRMPDKCAVVSGDTRLTYAALRDQVADVALALAARGVEPGDRVAVSTESASRHLVAMLGAMAAGAVPLALPRAESKSREEMLADARPKRIIACRDPVGALPTGAPPVDPLDALHGEGGRSEAPLPGYAIGDHEAPAMLYYTSGTTGGIRKGVIQSHRMLEGTARYIAALMRLDESAVEFVASPTDNAFWFGRCRVLLRVGGTIVLSTGALNPMRIIGAVERHGCNAISGDTPVFMMLLKYADKGFAAVAPRIRWIKIASQAMPAERKRELLEIAPNAHVVMNYGLTEAMRTCIIPMREHMDRLDSVGRSCPGVETRIASSDGETLPPNTRGEIQLRGVNLASGYLNKAEFWRQKFHGDWFRTGDLGRMDEEGFVYVDGRIDEALNIGGRTVAPAEIEANLKVHLQRTSFAVGGGSDPRGLLGDVAVLFVTGRWQETRTWPEIRSELLREYPGALVPAYAVSIPELPLTENGKIRRKHLRELFDSGCLSALQA